MRKLLLLLIIAINSNLFAMHAPAPIVNKNTKAIRVAFFIDDHNERFGKNGDKAVTREFARTLSQKASDVTIVSNYILKNMILRKYTIKPDPYLSTIHLNFNDWDIYVVNNSQFFIFTPRDYENKILNKELWTKIDLSDGPKYEGTLKKNFLKIHWDKDTPIEAKRLLSHKNLIYISYAPSTDDDVGNLEKPETTIHKKFDPIQLSLIFKTIKNYDEIGLSQPCNIYIQGHGSYALDKKDISIAGMSIENIVDSLIFFSNKLNTKSVRITSCYAGGKNLDLIRLKNKIHQKLKYILIIDSITDAPSFGAFSIEKSNIDLDLKGYFDALENFQGDNKTFIEKLTEIKANTTKPTAEIKEEIKKLEKTNGFEGVLQKLSLPNGWYFLPNGLSNFPQILIPETDWFQTFNTSPFVQKITHASIIKALAKPNIKTIKIDTKAGIQKEIKVLEHPDFEAHGTIDINKKLALLVYPEIVSVDLNMIPNSEVKSKILYKGTARKWLLNTYKYFPSIPSFDTVFTDKPTDKILNIYPEIVSMQHGDSLNLFAKINASNAGAPVTETGILNFLRDSFLILRKRKSEKTFFIKELEGFNDFSEILDDKDEFKQFLDTKKQAQKQIILNNVFIKTSENEEVTHIGPKLLNWTQITNWTRIKISFEFRGEAWRFCYDQKELNMGPVDLSVDKTQSLWRFEKSLPEHKANLKSAGLTYLASLTPTDYYKQLPIIRDRFQAKKASSTLPLKDFLIKLDPKVIMIEIEQQDKLTPKIQALQNALTILKQHLLMLGTKLQQVKGQLTKKKYFFF